MGIENMAYMWMNVAGLLDMMGAKDSNSNRFSSEYLDQGSEPDGLE